MSNSVARVLLPAEHRFHLGRLASQAEAAGIPVVSFEKRPGPSPLILLQLAAHWLPTALM